MPAKAPDQELRRKGQKLYALMQSGNLRAIIFWLK